VKTFVLFALLAVAVNASAQTCPSSCIRMPAGQSCSTAPAVDSTGTACTQAMHAAFDVPHGSLALAMGSPFTGCSGSVTMVDDYVVHGSLGPPGTFSAILTVNLAWTCGTSPFPGSIDVNLTQDGSNNARGFWKVSDVDCFLGPPAPAIPLILPIAIAPETPFRLASSIALSLGQQEAFDVRATLTFSGLPAGSSITSCKGYVEGSVPARTASWGRLKATYR
jgi:hypothetical protein